MKCPNCKATIDNNSKYCTFCGKLISNDTNIKKGNNNKEKLIDLYIGNNKEPIKEKSFSLPTLLLGTFYMLYRKMYLYTIISFLIFIISLLFSKYALLILIIRNIIFSIYFNTLYYNKISNKIDKMLEANTKESEIIRICQQKGGTSVIPIIIIIASAIALTIVIAIIYKSNLISSFNGFNSIIPDKHEFYDLKYEIPDKFQTSRFNNQYSKYYSYMDEDYNYCSFAINQEDLLSLYPTTEAYLKSKAIMTANDTISDIEQKIINDYNWQKLVITSHELKYIYAAKYNDRYYSLEYSTKKEVDACLPYYEQVLNSLKFK